MTQTTPQQRPTAVYRIYDADGQLLYVGITHRAVSRMWEHRSNGAWGAQIATVEWEEFPNRAQAARRERELVAEFRPPQNSGRFFANETEPRAGSLCPLCLLDGLKIPIVQKGWCKKHYLRWWKWGDPLAVRWRGHTPRPLAQRFWAKVDKNGPVPDYAPQLGPCWIWTAYRDKRKGYGKIGSGEGRGRTKAAHRVAYELLVGPIPQGLVLDHLCRVTYCVNPAHLEPVTNAENIRRGVIANPRIPSGSGSWQSSKTHCPQGHPYDEANTYRYKGERMCITCMRARTRRWQLANKKNRPAAGEFHGNAKLTWEKVAAIRAAYIPRIVTQAVLAERYAVSPSTISQILLGHHWHPRHRPERPAP